MAFGGSAFTKLLGSIKGITGKLFGGGAEKVFKPRSYGMPKVKGAGEVPEGKKPGGFLESIASGLKAFGGANSKKIIQGAGTLAISVLLIGGSLGILAAVFSSINPVLLVAFGFSLVELAGAMWIMSKIMGKISSGDILKGSFAMLVMSVALIPFAFAMQMMAGIPWSQMLISIGMAALAVLALAGIGAIMMTPAGLAFLFGAGALAIAGLSLMLFGASLLVAASGFNAMSTVDWNGFSGMGSALVSILPGLLGLAGIGLFAIPGLLMMSFALGSLAAVMVILAPAMQISAIATNSMAEGIGKLKEAVKGLDVEKLNNMASAAERLSTASAISGLANAVFGGSSEKGQTEQTVKIAPITINLRLNGREIQNLVIEDTKLVS